MKTREVPLSQYPWRWLLVGFFFVIPLASVGLFAYDPVLNILDVYRTKGKVMAEGKNADPVGRLKVKSYRIEEVQLPRSINVDIKGRNVAVDRVYTVTVTGGPFLTRGNPPIIWIDDTPLKYAQQSVDLLELTAYTYDLSLLRDGATITVTIGESDARTTLPEKINLKAGGAKGGK